MCVYMCVALTGDVSNLQCAVLHYLMPYSIVYVLALGINTANRTRVYVSPLLADCIPNNAPQHDRVVCCALFLHASYST